MIRFHESFLELAGIQSSSAMFQATQQHAGLKQATSEYRVRYSLRELEDLPKKKNDFLKAWKLVKDLPPSNPNSFWSIASYHGMPFKDRMVEPKDLQSPTEAWSGYCQHSNVLFPTWHRFYCLRMEQALQTVLPDGDVALHYWDTTSEGSRKEGLPPILVQPTVTIDGDPSIPNPLLDFKFPREIEADPDKFYVKPEGYTTMRYPFSGIVNPEEAKAVSEAHNTKIREMNVQPTELLQENVIYFINNGRYPGKGYNSVYSQFKDCLDTDDYNNFSNTTSVDHGDSCLEQPHNDIHLSIGGFTNPENPGEYFGLIQGSNGEMGANEVAAFDPIFFSHHSNIDRVFWIWQRKWDKQHELTIRPEIPEPGHNTGTSTKGQGPTPNQTPDQELNMDTILYPFQDEYGVPRTSNDCVDIEGQLGYTYSRGSLEDAIIPSIASRLYTRVVEKLEEIEIELRQKSRVTSNQPLRAVFDLSKLVAKYPLWGNFLLLKPSDSKVIHFADRKWKRFFTFKISNLDKDAYPGSFLVRTYAKKADKLIFLGHRGVLDRWERKLCSNCQNRRFASLGFRLAVDTPVDPNHIVAHLVSKDPLTGTEVVTDLGVKYEPEAAQSKSQIQPTFQIAIRFDEVKD
ncbi:hypothetical protein LOTGIDRAFT_234481 [Lottia gigantea]|uniref:Tyrosinase copper-binding domain-containing protein n=1 Tax=Lottia gigantea TaxID=225164 RepID=V4A5X3_LOTGI|nr:hypothetical protein LOTGIDRAFT_234481 [Lottia gigantea]ESO88681.1 hypothetical protein LOTGIDRAFT_234481 [Lottia gigantea]